MLPRDRLPLVGANSLTIRPNESATVPYYADSFLKPAAALCECGHAQAPDACVLARILRRVHVDPSRPTRRPRTGGTRNDVARGARPR